MHTTVFLTALISFTQATSCNKNLIENLNFKLSGNDLVFPSQDVKSIYTSTGRYIPKNVIATRLQIYNDTAIVALPRYRPGVPFTLGKFTLQDPTQLQPFPYWSIQEEGNCQAVQNAIDLYLDPLEKLWVLDLGICNTLEQPVKRCAPKVWGFDAASGNVVKTVSLESLIVPGSRLQYIVVDYSQDETPHAYIADGGSGAIIVVDILKETGHRVVLPPAVSVNCGSNDVLYIELARKSSGNVLYFSYLSSPRLFSIKARYLQTGRGASRALVDVGSKPSGNQMVLLGTDNGSALFFRYKGSSDIYVWNSDSSLEDGNFLLVQSGGDCRMATQVVAGWRKLMWAIESNFHDYLTDSTGCFGASVVIYPLVKTSD